MRRQILPTLLVTLLLSSVVGFAYFSNNPDSPLLERAEPWPVVGPVAGWFRSAYLGPPASSELSDDAETPAAVEGANGPIRLAAGAQSRQGRENVREPAAERPVRRSVSDGRGERPERAAGRSRSPSEDELLRAAGLRRAGARPPDARSGPPPLRASRVAAPAADSPADARSPAAEREPLKIVAWELVQPGVDVRADADSAAVKIRTLSAMSYLPVLDRRGSWAQVMVRGVSGWVDLDQEPPFNRRRARRGILRHRREPVRPNDGFVLRSARKLLGIKRETGNLGDYALYSDVEDQQLLDYLDLFASQAEHAYFARYGRLPSGNPRRSVLLFSREETYRSLAQETADIPEAGTWQAGHAGRGIIGMFVEGKDQETLAGTLVHEIAHLLNDRSLAYSLPIWLEEGIASDLGAIWVEPDPNVRLGNRIRVDGVAARYLALEDLLRDGRGPPLASLLGLDRESFYRSEIRRHAYDLSFAFVRYLLDGENSRHADGFREFLGNIAAGMGANLIEQLGVEGAELEAGFYRWLSEEIAETRADLERRVLGG